MTKDEIIEILRDPYESLGPERRQQLADAVERLSLAAEPEPTSHQFHGLYYDAEKRQIVRTPVEPEEEPDDDLPGSGYRVLNADDSIAAEGKVVRHGHEYRFDPPPTVSSEQRLMYWTS